MAIFKTQEILLNTESSFCAGESNPAGNSYGTRIPVLSVRPSLRQDRQTDGSIQSRANESRPGYLMPTDGELEFTTLWPGYMSDVGTGTITATWHHLLMAGWLGGSHVADDGGTISSATDADSMVTTGVTGLTAGGVVLIGDDADGRADGQPAVVSTWSGGTLELLTALPGTPSAADKVRPCQVSYWDETAAVETRRFCVGFTASGEQYHMLGAACDSVTFDLNVQRQTVPTTTFRYRHAYWEQDAITIPSGTAMSDCLAAPIGGGACYLQAFGTSTRQLLAPSSVRLTVDFVLAERPGQPSGANNYRRGLTGYERVQAIPTIELTIPEADYTSIFSTGFGTDGSGSTHYHVLWNNTSTSTAVPGRVVGFYMPRAYLIGTRPTFADANGLLHKTFMLRGRESSTTTSQLTRSAIRFFAG